MYINDLMKVRALKLLKFAFEKLLLHLKSLLNQAFRKIVFYFINWFMFYYFKSKVSQSALINLAQNGFEKIHWINSC